MLAAAAVAVDPLLAERLAVLAARAAVVLADFPLPITAWLAQLILAVVVVVLAAIHMSLEVLAVLVLSSSATPTHTQTPRRLLDRLRLPIRAAIKFTCLPAAGA
jgi:hypothetical protein